MAKRKRSRSSRNSDGGNNYDTKLRNENRREWNESIDRFIAQVQAFNLGKKAKITIPNPNKNETNKRFIKVDAWDVLKRRA
tara:strand:+ start:121 stop:363 length:243 start_codon:yes stop_codon:yes gene_type:complete